MAIVKELNTRIALKYDSYAAWTDESVAGKGANLVLLPGEIGICEIPVANGASNVAPTVLFKVGGAKNEDGSLKSFKELPWASAKAADVYGWAKASDVQLEGKTIKFIGTDKTITLNYVTEAEVKAITDPIAARVATLEGKFGASGDFTTAIAGLDERLDVIEGSGEGSVAKALADAKEYTNTREAAIKAAYEAYADQAEVDAKAYVDAEVAKDRTRLGDLEAADAAQDLLIAANTKAVEDEAKARADADTAINEKIGGSYTKDATVHAAIVDAKAAGTTAQQQVTDLTNGQVATNTGNIATNAAGVAANAAAISAEEGARIAADNALSGRLDKVETFFKLEDGETLDTALDTLVEIQEYLNGDGNAANSLINRLAAAEGDIDDLEAEFAAGGRVTAAEADIAANESAIAALQQVTNGYTGDKAIYNRVEAVSVRAEKGITDAAAAAEAASVAQGEIDALEAVVNNGTTGLGNTYTIATGAAAGVAALETRMGTAEGEIDALQAIVQTGDDTNAKLREAITDLQGIVKTGADANATLRSDLSTLKGVVEHGTTGLAKTKEIADGAASKAAENAGKIAAIEADYLTAADEYIFNCGSSTTVIHTKAV